MHGVHYGPPRSMVQAQEIYTSGMKYLRAHRVLTLISQRQVIMKVF